MRILAGAGMTAQQNAREALTLAVLLNRPAAEVQEWQRIADRQEYLQEAGRAALARWEAGK